MSRKQWFIDRIGKRVFRNKTTCDCKTCTRVHQEGLIISDETHADYVAGVEAISTAEGSPLRYFDKKEEATEFEKSVVKS